MQLFNSKDFPVFHNILYRFSEHYKNYESLPYLNYYLVERTFVPKNRDLDTKSNTFLDALNKKVYKPEYPYLIVKEVNDDIFYYIPVTVYYLIITEITAIEFYMSTLINIKKESDDNNTPYVVFKKHKKSSEKAFLQNSNVSLSNLITPEENTTFTKVHLIKLLKYNKYLSQL